MVHVLELRNVPIRTLSRKVCCEAMVVWGWWRKDTLLYAMIRH